MVNDDYTKSDQGELALQNVTEELVVQNVRALISTMDMCSCEKCVLNACAIALNSLSPQYVTTAKGAILVKLRFCEDNYQTVIVCEVIKALLQVKGHPLH